MRLMNFINEQLIAARNKYAEGKKLGELEKYDRNNPEHDDPKKYLYFSTGATVYSHTIEAIKQVKIDQPLQMLATALHDTGKGVTLSDKKGLPTYYGHAKESIELVNSIADRLKMSNKERNALLFAVGNHMKFHNILGMKTSKIVKLVNDDNWDVLVAVSFADSASRGSSFIHAGEFEKIVDKCIKLKDKYNIKEVKKRLKLVDGNRVMELLGLKPGPKVGKIIKEISAWVIDNDIKDTKLIDIRILEYET